MRGSTALLAILCCITCQRFFGLSGQLANRWINQYLKFLIEKLSNIHSIVGLSIIIMVPLGFFSLVNYLFLTKSYPVLDLLWLITVLLCCLNANNPRQQLAKYFYFENQDTLPLAESAVPKNLIDKQFSNQNDPLPRKITNLILGNSFEQLLAGLSWFVLLGSLGTINYFIVNSLVSYGRLSSKHHQLFNYANYLKNLLDWVPATVIGIIYALAGNFTAGFDCYRKTLLSKNIGATAFTIGVGIAALNYHHFSASTPAVKENQATLTLVNHALTIWLISAIILLLAC